MKSKLLSLLTILALSGAAAAEDGWISMFNGKDLTGWKSNSATDSKSENKDATFVVENGELKVQSGRSHIFYVGPDGNAKFKNFEFKAKVKTTPGSNGGIYIHTAFLEDGYPTEGYECQVNATHKDVKKTGGLYAVKDVLNTAPHKDDEWFDYGIKVEGKKITITINGKVTTEWTEPDDWDPKKSLKNMDGRKLSEGLIGIQGHDPKSVVYYKDLFIKPLP